MDNGRAGKDDLEKWSRYGEQMVEPDSEITLALIPIDFSKVKLEARLYRGKGFVTRWLV